LERKLTGRDLIFNGDGLVYPSQVFERPADVNYPDRALNKKRAIVASWASDACAIEAAPALRQIPIGCVVEFDEIMDALRTLDQQAQVSPARPRTVGRNLTAFGTAGRPSS